MSWKVLRAEHPSLKPVQLHRILTQYKLTGEVGSVPIWQPSIEDEAYVYRTGEGVTIVRVILRVLFQKSIVFPIMKPCQVFHF